MLKRITVRGFKSIKEQTIELGALNILIGANGSGKSNLLGALFFFRDFALGGRNDLVRRLGGVERLLYHGKKITKTCFFACEEETFAYAQTLIPVPGDRLAVTKKDLTNLDNEIESTRFDLGDEEEYHLADIDNLGQTATQHLEGWSMYHLHDTSATAAIKSACNIDDNRALREDASNLAAYLYWLKLKEPDAYQRIVSIVRLAIPYFEDFTLAPMRLDERTIRLEWKQRDSEAYFDADSLSDGSLRFVGLTTLLNQPARNMPSLIVIDEPELGLHPLAIRLLAEMLDAASRHTQILVATQSVTLLDHFPVEQIIVADHDGHGSQFRRLRPEDYAAWLENFSVGELWEKNVFGGRP